MPDCVFCKIRDGQLPSMRVYENERTICFMDINPLNPGHCLVVTRAHAPTIFDADEQDLAAAITAARRVAGALLEAVKPDGLNLLQANGAAAFQSVPHFHLHLIPRWANDGKGFDWALTPGDRAQIMAIGEKLRTILRSGGGAAAPPAASPHQRGRGPSPRSSE
jgi:histidine triad (HIT) family protein